MNACCFVSFTGVFNLQLILQITVDVEIRALLRSAEEIIDALNAPSFRGQVP